MTVSFYYLRGSFYQSPELQYQHEERIEALLKGEIGLDQTEILQDGICSLRLSIKARLLFTTEEVDGEFYLSVLEYLPNHEYHKSRFLQSGVLKRYREKNKQFYAQMIDKTKAEQAQIILKALTKTYKKKGKEGRPQVLEFYQNELLILDPIQQKALKLRLPAILSGIAGSGKSVIALTSIANYVTNLNKTPRRRILYISKSEALVQQIKHYWKQLPESAIPHHTVDFLSLEFLIEEGLKLGSTLIDKDFFKDFCHSYFSNQNKNHNAGVEINHKKIREEFLICSGYDEKTYLDLGKDQSTVSKEKRKIYYLAYQKYLSHLKTKGRLDPDFYALDLDNYDLILMDEAQDLSYHAINSIHSKADEDAILYCMDSHQRLGSSKSVRPYLLNKIGNDPKRHISLVSTRRCPVKVVNAANMVLTFKQLMVEGIGDKYETPNIQSVASEKGLGSVFVCDEKNLLELPWMAQKKQAYFVVITSKKNCEDPATLEAIKKRFNATQVLSPEQAKGLEYDVVLAYDLYDEEVFKSLKDRIDSLNEESKASSHQPKNPTEHEDCVCFCNEVYTSYTRAKTALIVCEKETRHNKTLLNKIKEGADKGLPPEDLFSKQSTKEDWELEVTKQLQVGNENLAKNTFLNHLVVKKEEREEEYEAFVRNLRTKTKPPEAPKREGIKTTLKSYQEEKKTNSSTSPLEKKQLVKKSQTQLSLEKEIVTRATSTIIKALRPISDAKLFNTFFSGLVMFLAKERHTQILKKALPEAEDCWFRDGGKSHSWATGIKISDHTDNLRIIAILQKYLKTMRHDNQEFLQKEFKIESESCLNRKISLNIRVLSENESKKWRFSPSVSKFKKIIELCDMEVTQNPISQFNEIIYNKTAMATLKSKSIEDYKKIKMYHLREDILGETQLTHFKKTDWVLATLRMELEGKMYPLCEYITWMNNLANPDPIANMANESQVFLVPLDYTLIESAIKDTAQLFEKAIKWDGADLESLQQKIKLIHSELALIKPLNQGSDQVSDLLAQVIYSYHKLECPIALDQNLEINAPIALLEEFSQENVSNHTTKSETPPLVIHTSAPNIPKNQTPSISLDTLAIQMEQRLFKDFNEKIFLNLMKIAKDKIKPLYQIVYTKTDGSTQTLLDFLEENPEQCKLFLKWASNNLSFLLKINFEVPSTHKNTPFTWNLLQLRNLQVFFEKSLKVQPHGNSSYNNPAHQLLKVYSEYSHQMRLPKNSQIIHLRALIEIGSDLEENGNDGRDNHNKIIHLAASLNDTDTLAFLHSQNMDLGEPKQNGDTVAHIAAIKGHKEVFSLLKKLNYTHLFTKYNDLYLTPSHYLASYNHYEVYDELVEFKSELDLSVNDTIMKPSHVAATYGYVEVLKKLHGFGTKLDQGDARGVTPLMWAVMKGHYEVVKFLIEAYAFTNPSYYISSEEATLCFKKDSAYASRLKDKIRYLIRTEHLRKALVKNPEGIKEVPINLAQLALAVGDEKSAKLLQELILEKYHQEPEAKTEEASWLNYFSITEPRLHKPDDMIQSRKNYILNMNRLLREDTFNEASLMALWENSEYQTDSLHLIIIKSEPEKQSLMDYIVTHEKIANLFIKCMVNNTFLLTKVQFIIPINTPIFLKQKLKHLQEIQLWMKNYFYMRKTLVEIPIHILVEYDATNLPEAFPDFHYLLFLLYQCGADLTVPNIEGRQLIHYAVLPNKRDLFDFLALKVDLSVVLNDGKTLAHFGAENNNIALLMKLRKLDFIKLLFQPNHQGITPAHILAEQGYEDTFNETFSLCEGHDLDVPDFTIRCRPSHKAAAKGCINILSTLDRLNSNLDQRTVFGDTPLSMAINHGQYDAVRFLVSQAKHKVDLYRRHPISWDDIENSENPSKFINSLSQFKKKNPRRSWVAKVQAFIPLDELALFNQHIIINEYLLEEMKKVKPPMTLSYYTKDTDQIKQIHLAWIAAFTGDLLILDILDSSYKVSLDQVDEDGFGLAHFAAQSGCEAVLRWIGERIELKHLLSLPSKSGITPAYLCVHYDKNAALKLLWQLKVDINKPYIHTGFKPVHVAALHNDTDALMTFRSAGLLRETIETEDAKGVTPLMIAIMSRHIAAVGLLIKFKSLKKCSITLESFNSIINPQLPNIKEINSRLEAKMREQLLKKDELMVLDEFDIAHVMGFEPQFRKAILDGKDFEKKTIPKLSSRPNGVSKHKVHGTKQSLSPKHQFFEEPPTVPKSSPPQPNLEPPSL